MKNGTGDRGSGTGNGAHPHARRDDVGTPPRFTVMDAARPMDPTPARVRKARAGRVSHGSIAPCAGAMEGLEPGISRSQIRSPQRAAPRRARIDWSTVPGPRSHAR